MIEVRQIRSDEWRRLKAIRLEALADTPSAFATPLTEAKAYPDTVWQERAQLGADGEDQITVVAVAGDRTLGMTVALGHPRSDRRIVPIVSVYVTPSARRKGIAVRLLGLAEEWIREQGGLSASLWVEEHNHPARSFYGSTGYVATLDRQAMPSSPGAWEIRLEKALSPAG